MLFFERLIAQPMKPAKAFVIGGSSLAVIGFLIAGCATWLKFSEGMEWKHAFVSTLSPYYWSLRLQALNLNGNDRSGLATTDSASHDNSLKFSGPGQFASWMSSDKRKWSETDFVRYDIVKLAKCEENDSDYGEYRYACSDGYYKVSTPLGDSICTVDTVSYWRNLFNSRYSIRSKECRTPKEIAETRQGGGIPWVFVFGGGVVTGVFGVHLKRRFEQSS